MLASNYLYFNYHKVPFKGTLTRLELDTSIFIVYLFSFFLNLQSLY
jgi:hypothetical protein